MSTWRCENYGCGFEAEDWRFLKGGDLELYAKYDKSGTPLCPNCELPMVKVKEK